MKPLAVLRVARRIITAMVAVGLVSYVTTLVWEYEKVSKIFGDPMGRIAYVKLHNPDVAPGTPHIVKLVKFAKEHGYDKVLVIHNAGVIGYVHFKYRGVLIVQLGWMDKRGNYAPPNENMVWEDILYGHRPAQGVWVADDRTWPSERAAVKHVLSLLRSTPGRTMFVWHGSVRYGNPLLDPGCGGEPYYWLLFKYGGRVLAYTMMIVGDFSPFLFYGWKFTEEELLHYKTLQKLYNDGFLNTHAVTPDLKKIVPMGREGSYTYALD